MSDLSTSESYAQRLDREDPLAAFRDEFLLPGEKDGKPCVYFCGHSLGLQPKTVRAYVEQELHDWAKLGVDGHFQAKNPWMPYHELLTEQTARLVGARPGEVVVMNTLTVNLHLMMVSFYQPTPERYRVLMEAKAFPSDQYAVQSHVRFRGYDPKSAIIEMHPREGEAHLRTEDIADTIRRDGKSIALIMFGGVNYYSAQLLDMQEITRAGHAAGCTVGFDLAHAAGNVPLKLHDWNIDFGVWCSYKYMNGGPGCIAGAFVHEKHASRSELPRFAGWWGHDKETRFQMPDQFQPIKGAEGWQLSNPPILSLAALRASMDIFDRAGMERLRQKSLALTRYLAFLLHERCGDFVEVLTPVVPEMRGSQLSLRIAGEGRDLYARIQRCNVFCDWREPDVIRAAPVPLYNRFIDVFKFVDTLVACRAGQGQDTTTIGKEAHGR